jgi:hypothetical protein
MNTGTRQQIKTALLAFSGSNLRAASIGLLKSLGYQSEKTLDLDSTPNNLLAEFGKRDRKFRKILNLQHAPGPAKGAGGIQINRPSKMQA